ncbi:MAG: hypothetical protein ABIZ91_06720 [Gemmatimonadaceae bacterium]
MAALRLLMLSLVLALGTILTGWWSVPVIAALYGGVSHRERRSGRVAALAAALAWGGYLGIAALGGAPVTPFGVRLAASMSLPPWAPIIATLCFPALLAGMASYLGAWAGGRYLSPS